MPTQLLTVNAVTKGFVVNQPPIVKNISFSVYPDEILRAVGTQWLWKDHHFASDRRF